LNLYRYSEKTRTELLEIMQKVSDRIWIPHQVALEYHTNRISVIEKQQKAYREIINKIDDAFNSIQNYLNDFMKHPVINISPFLNEISDVFDKIKNNLIKQEENHPDLLQNDNIRDDITKLFEDKVGPEYSEDDLQKIYSRGEKRYEQGVPPGYSDSKKSADTKKTKTGNEQYGDLILWHQALDKAKQSQKSIILITDDTKEDWWWRHGDNITIGPRPELVKEMLSIANAKFYMYRSDKFMEYAMKYLKRSIDKKAIDEVREIRKKDDKIIKIISYFNEIDLGCGYDGIEAWDINLINKQQKLMSEINDIKQKMRYCGERIVKIKGTSEWDDKKAVDLLNNIYYLEKQLKQKEEQYQQIKRITMGTIFSKEITENIKGLLNEISDNDK
jgi:hypothetical protein